ncbi:DinB family protein [Pseudoalteromonas sp. B193]
MRESVTNDTNQNVLVKRFCSVRDESLAIIEPLTVEDCQLQAMADVSPTKWHLAHTTWFLKHFYLVFIVNSTQCLTLTIKCFLILTTMGLESNLNGQTEEAYLGQV